MTLYCSPHFHVKLLETLDTEDKDARQLFGIILISVSSGKVREDFWYGEEMGIKPSLKSNI